MAKVKRITKTDLKRVDSIIADQRERRWALIPLLHEVQGVLGYIPPEAIPRIAGGLGLFPSQVQGVISFYTQFYTEPRGKNIVRVCRGTACHVKGGSLILEALERELEIKVGDTTPDGEFSLDRVACIGCCTMAPVMVIGEDIYPKMTTLKVEENLIGSKEKEQHT